MEAKIDLRTLRTEDLSAADKLRQAAGWNQTLTDWQRLLELDPEGCFAAVDGSEIVGTATTTSFGTELAWIGMVLVDPARRNQGVGRQLLSRCLDYLKGKGIRCIKLDATPAGQILYEKLGFQVEWPLARWMRPESSAPSLPASEEVMPVRENDWDEICELDRRFFGTDRSELLRLLERDSRAAFVFREDGNLTSFGFLREGINADYIGPFIVLKPEAGKAIMQALLCAAHRQIYWDISSPCGEANACAEQLGFAVQRPLLRMFLGDNPSRGHPDQLWAITDPATG